MSMVAYHNHFLRHASIATTQVYAESDPGALAAAVADW